MIKKKANFAMPPLEALCEDAQRAKSLLNDDDDELDLGSQQVFDELSINIDEDMGLFDGRRGEEFDLPNWTQELYTGYERLNEIQPNMCKLGIHGLEGRIKEGSTERSFCTSAFTKKALTLDHIVSQLIIGTFSLEEAFLGDGESFTTIPSPFLMKPIREEGESVIGQWRYLYCPKATLPIALVALTPVTIQFVPHGKVNRSVWDKLTVGGEANNRKRIGSHVLSLDFCKILSTE